MNPSLFFEHRGSAIARRVIWLLQSWPRQSQDNARPKPLTLRLEKQFLWSMLSCQRQYLTIIQSLWINGTNRLCSESMNVHDTYCDRKRRDCSCACRASVIEHIGWCSIVVKGVTCSVPPFLRHWQLRHTCNTLEHTIKWLSLIGLAFINSSTMYVKASFAGSG